MSTKSWWSNDHPPRVLALALLEMQGDTERQRNFMATHVPEHLRELTRSHYKNALALGKSDEEG